MSAPGSFRDLYDLYDRLFPEWTVFVPPGMEAQARALVAGVEGVAVAASPYLPEGVCVMAATDSRPGGGR